MNEIEEDPLGSFLCGERLHRLLRLLRFFVYATKRSEICDDSFLGKGSEGSKGSEGLRMCF